MAVRSSLKNLLKEGYMCIASYLLIRVMHKIFRKSGSWWWVKLPQSLLLIATDFMLYIILSEQLGSPYGALASVFIFMLTSSSVYFGILSFRPEKINYFLFIMVFCLIFHDFKCLNNAPAMLLAGTLCGAAVLFKASALMQAAAFFCITALKGYYDNEWSGILFFSAGTFVVIAPFYLPTLPDLCRKLKMIQKYSKRRNSELKSKSLFYNKILLPLCSLWALNYYFILLICLLVAKRNDISNQLFYVSALLWLVATVAESLAQDLRHFFARTPCLLPYCTIPACCIALIDFSDGSPVKYWAAFFPLLFSFRPFDLFRKRSLNAFRHYRAIETLASRYKGSGDSGPILVLADSPQFYLISERKCILDYKNLWLVNFKCLPNWSQVAVNALLRNKPEFIFLENRKDLRFDSQELFLKTGLVYFKKANEANISVYGYKGSVFSTVSEISKNEASLIFSEEMPHEEFIKQKKRSLSIFLSYIRDFDSEYALYGMGRYTSETLDALLETGLRLPCVIYDDNPKGKKLKGVPVECSERIAESGYPLILSSDIFNTRLLMYRSLKALKCSEERITDVYTKINGINI